MSVLMLRFSGPLQSWGDASRFSRRTTRHEPTKSGIVGLLASALGRSREDPIDDLANLEIAVRVDQCGEVIRDFQTAHPAGKDALPISSRYYLSDAKFIVAVAGQSILLHKLSEAVKKPHWPLYLGRRSCPPDTPVFLALKEDVDDPRVALETEPWHAEERYKRLHGAERLQMVCDARDGELCESQADFPLSFSLSGRRYACRPVTRYFIDIPDLALQKSLQVRDDASVGLNGDSPFLSNHDPMSAL